MDRFNSSRARIREIENKEEKNESKIKTIEELIEEEFRLEASYKKEKIDITEGRMISENNTLLPMVQREEIFRKKCQILSKYMALFQKNYNEYRKVLKKIGDDKNLYGKKMFKQGFESGAESMRLELSPIVDEISKKNKKLEKINHLLCLIVFSLLFLLGIFTYFLYI